LHDYVPREQLAIHLRSANLHLVSLEAAWTGTMLPSKLQGIFAGSRPVVFIGDARSSLARWIRESGGGWVVKPGDVNGLMAAISEASAPRVCRLRGRAAQAYAMLHFDRRTNACRVADWMETGIPQSREDPFENQRASPAEQT
jgi:colanic acid biosynthesis glycosyl transferase WcaI